MSCDVKFEKSLGFDCIQEIISDVRTGNLTPETVKKGLWALGCGVEFFLPTPLMMGQTEETQTKTMEELCSEIEGCLPMYGSEKQDEEKVQINPLLFIALVQLVIQVIQALRNKKV